MEPGFSETAFSHVVIRELDRTLPTFRAPYFPTTRAEFLEPFDVEWSLTATRSLFIQFKVSEYLDHPRAAERNAVPCPYYRFRLHHSHGTCTQHNLLKDLSDAFPGSVMYVAPLFYTYDDYDAHRSAWGVAKNSIAVDVNRMSWFTDSRRHCVAYSRAHIAEFSEPRDLGGVLPLEEALKKFSGYTAERRPLNLQALEETVTHLRSVNEQLSIILKKRDVAPPPSADNIDPESRLYRLQEGSPTPRLFIDVLLNARRIEMIANAYFGAHWVGLA